MKKNINFFEIKKLNMGALCRSYNLRDRGLWYVIIWLTGVSSHTQTGEGINYGARVNMYWMSVSRSCHERHVTRVHSVQYVLLLQVLICSLGREHAEVLYFVFFFDIGRQFFGAENMLGVLFARQLCSVCMLEHYHATVSFRR